MAVRPVVDGIESEWKDRLTVIRLDIQDDNGSALGRELGAIYTPTFVLFDEQGRERLRSIGRLDPDDVRRVLLP
jgi:thiol-disulfide isomerase/thioredoxin